MKQQTVSELPAIIEMFEDEFEGQAVRMLQDSTGVIWFIGKSTARKLGHADTDWAIRRYVDLEDRRTFDFPEFNSGKSNSLNSKGKSVRGRPSIWINESGLYSLIMGSKKAEAKRFKHWVTSEVLPSIRKTGQYSTSQRRLDETLLVERKVQKLLSTDYNRQLYEKGVRCPIEFGEEWNMVHVAHTGMDAQGIKEEADRQGIKRRKHESARHLLWKGVDKTAAATESLEIDLQRCGATQAIARKIALGPGVALYDAMIAHGITPGVLSDFVDE